MRTLIVLLCAITIVLGIASAHAGAQGESQSSHSRGRLNLAAVEGKQQFYYADVAEDLVVRVMANEGRLVVTGRGTDGSEVRVGVAEPGRPVHAKGKYAHLYAAREAGAAAPSGTFTLTFNAEAPDPGAPPAQAAPATERAAPDRTISTSGEATVYVVPDEVIVRLGAVHADAKLEEAKARNDAAARAMLAAIKALGVEDKHLQTDAVQVEIQYHNGGAKSGIAAYIVTRSYAVTLKDAGKLEALLDAALANGANVLEGVEYRTTKLREHRDKARAMAVQAAKEKASLMAGVLEMKVGPPRTINEVGDWYFGGYFRGQGGNRSMTQNAMVSVGGQGGESGETVPMGQVAVRANVSVVFDLEPE